jgi:hypothetical protein
MESGRRSSINFAKILGLQLDERFGVVDKHGHRAALMFHPNLQKQ